MGRLKFDLKPVGPRRDWTIERHNDHLRDFYAKYEFGEVAPCECGFHVEGMVCGCPPEERKHQTPDRVKRRLEHHHRQEHMRGLRAKREFPGPPHDGKGVGWCRWCGGELFNAKGLRSKQAKWHNRCLSAYFLHTDHVAQRRHLKDRDGEGCKRCGAKEWGDVDHVIALAAAWEAFGDNPDRFRWFFSPRALQLLCGACHRAKTKEDVAFIRACQRNGREWAKAEIIARLRAAGLLKPVDGR